MSKLSASEPGDRCGSQLKVFMFTDLVESSATVRKLGDVEYVRQVLEPHNEVFRRLLSEYRGATEVKHTGDGFMATFTSASDAALCGLRFQNEIRTQSWESVEPQVCIGIHLGEAVEFSSAVEGEHDLAGDAANMTARIMSLARPGQTLLSRFAFDSARQSGRVIVEEIMSGPQHLQSEVCWLNHGTYLMKGAEEPLEVCEVGLTDVSPLQQPADSAKVRRVVSDEEAAMLGWRPSPNTAIPHRPNWKLRELLGEGGFGEVWLARHKRTKEERAFKFCFDADKLRSFKRELTIFRLIRDHLGERPDIGKLFEVQIDDPPFFLEGEYVAGGNLKQWAEKQGGIQNIPIETRLQLVCDIANSIAAAHSLGIIHRDIKPSNVLIVEEKGSVQPKLVDFGIGLLSSDELLSRNDITQTGFTESLILGKESSRTGTRMYAPPESLQGKPSTTAGDIYALGVLLFQVIVEDFGRPIGTGWEDEIADETLRSDISRYTHYDSMRRPKSASDIADDLRELENRRLLREKQTFDKRMLEINSMNSSLDVIFNSQLIGKTPKEIRHLSLAEIALQAAAQIDPMDRSLRACAIAHSVGSMLLHTRFIDEARTVLRQSIEICRDHYKVGGPAIGRYVIAIVDLSNEPDRINELLGTVAQLEAHPSQDKTVYESQRSVASAYTSVVGPALAAGMHYFSTDLLIEEMTRAGEEAVASVKKERLPLLRSFSEAARIARAEAEVDKLWSLVAGRIFSLNLELEGPTSSNTKIAIKEYLEAAQQDGSLNDAVHHIKLTIAGTLDRTDQDMLLSLVDDFCRVSPKVEYWTPNLSSEI